MTSGEHGPASRREPSRPADDSESPRDRAARWLRGAALWTLPPRALAFVLAVDVVAVVLGLLTALSAPPAPGDVATALVLALGAVVHLEAARHIERIRNQESADGGAPYIDAKSMWTFAGLVLLAPGPALALVVFTLLWWRLRVSRRPPPHRWVFSAATIVIASCAAAGVLALAGPDPLHRVAEGPEVVLVLMAAALVRWTVNHGLVVAVISLSVPSAPWRQRVGSVTDNLIGLGALALGIALAVLVEATPWLVPVLLVPVLAMHRGVLLGHFARAARTDPKTGVASIGHWREQAVRGLARARRRGQGVGVLMVDLDEFKAVNDRHGHLAGDRVLRAVADALRDEVRADDAVGRFGGEEFVVLVSAVSPDQLVLVAERIRRRIGRCRIVVGVRVGEGGADRRAATTGTTPTPSADGDAGTGAVVVTGLTASVGAASHPATSDDVDGLVLAADAALYQAKRAGRDRVATADGPVPGD